MRVNARLCLMVVLPAGVLVGGGVVLVVPVFEPDAHLGLGRGMGRKVGHWHEGVLAGGVGFGRNARQRRVDTVAALLGFRLVVGVAGPAGLVFVVGDLGSQAQVLLHCFDTLLWSRHCPSPSKHTVLPLLSSINRLCLCFGPDTPPEHSHLSIHLVIPLTVLSLLALVFLNRRLIQLISTNPLPVHNLPYNVLLLSHGYLNVPIQFLHALDPINHLLLLFQFPEEIATVPPLHLLDLPQQPRPPLHELFPSLPLPTIARYLKLTFVFPVYLGLHYQLPTFDRPHFVCHLVLQTDGIIESSLKLIDHHKLTLVLVMNSIVNFLQFLRLVSVISRNMQLLPQPSELLHHPHPFMPEFITFDRHLL